MEAAGISKGGRSWPGDRRWRLRGKPTPLALLAIAAVVALLVLLPLGFLLDQALSIGWTQVDALLFRPFVGTLLVNTVLLVAVATTACVLLGVAVAWCVERTDLPGRRAWAVLAALPITVPAFVTSYSWVSITPAVQDFGGAALIVTLAYYPLVYLPVAAVLRGMDPALEESARSLGCGPWRTFVRVTLPQARLALLGGSLLVARELAVGIRRLLDAALSDVHDGDLRRVPSELRRPGRVAACDRARAACASCCSSASCGVRGSARYARVDTGSPRPRHARPAGASPVAGARRLSALVGLALGLPLGTLVYWVAHGGSTASHRVAAVGGGLLAGLGLGAALLTTLLAPARLDPHDPLPEPHRERCSNAPPISPTRCRASSWRCR